MSKKDHRRNRDSHNNFQEDFDLANHHFDEIEDSFNSSLDEADKEFERATASLKRTLSGNVDDKALAAVDREPLVDDSEEDEESGSGLFSKIGSVLSVIPFSRLGSAIRALPVGLWSALCWSGGKIRSAGAGIAPAFRKIGSLLVLKGEDDEESVEQELERLEAKEKIQAQKTHARQSVPSQKEKDEKRSKTSSGTKQVDDEIVPGAAFIEDEDEESGVSWLGYLVKGAAVAAVLLLAVSGYFGIKSIFSKKDAAGTEIALQATPTASDADLKSSAPPDVKKNDASTPINASGEDKVALPKTASPVKPKAANPSTNKNVPPADELQKKASSQSGSPPPGAVAPPKKAAPDSPNPKTSDKPTPPGNSKPAVPPPSGQKEKKPAPPGKESRQNRPKAKSEQSLGMSAAPPATPEKTLPKTASNLFDPALVSETPQTAAAGNANASGFGDPWAPPPAETNSAPAVPTGGNQSVPMRETPSFSAFASPVAETPQSDMTFDTPKSAAQPAVKPTASESESHPASSMFPALASASAVDSMPITGKTLAEADQQTPSRKQNPAESLPVMQPLASVPGHAVSEPTASNDRSGSVPLRPLNDLAATPQPRILSAHESSPGIPNSPGEQSFGSSQIGSAPLAPKMDSMKAVSFGIDDSIKPLAAPTELPADQPLKIPNGGETPILVNFPSTNVSPAHGESTPGIPNDSSLAVSTRSAATAANSGAAFAPLRRNVPDVPTPTSAPAVPLEGSIAIPADGNLAAAPMQPLSGENNAAGMSRMRQSGTLSPESVPNSISVSQSNGSANSPLGSRLQNHLQDLRNDQALEPQLRFGNGSDETVSRSSPPVSGLAGQGAVKFEGADQALEQNKIMNPGSSTIAWSGAPLQSMPNNPNDPNENPLLNLNPTGRLAPNASTIEQTLPPATVSPTPVFAEVQPGYGRSLNSQKPARVRVTDSTATNSDRAQRAQLFRRQLDEEITRSPASTERYTVQPNDTYMTICDRHYGTSLLFRALAEHNRRQGIAYMPQPGTVIEVPTAEFLKTNYAEILSRGGRRREARQTTGQPNLSSTSLRSGQYYTVRENDNVFKIATNLLGDSSRWQEIVALNSDLLQSARDLQPGMQIMLPSKTTTSALSNASSASQHFVDRR